MEYEVEDQPGEPRHPRLVVGGETEPDSSQFERLAEIAWDILVVLDATRWDFWDGHVGSGEAAQSPASCTKAWVTQLLHRFDMSDVDCITANPEVTRRALPDSFRSRDDIWERRWEYVNGLGTVSPDAVSEAVEAKMIAGPDRRIYAHYAQPHGPYPKADRPIPVMRNNPEASNVEAEDRYTSDEIIMDPSDVLADPDHWITVKKLQDGYLANLEWAWQAVKPLTQLGETVVITSDHGEFLGETVRGKTADGEVTVKECFYGHPCPIDHPILRTVPVAVYD